MENQTELIEVPKHKLYNKKSVGLATFLGGPIAGAMLLQRNYINSGDEKKGIYALIIGIAATILILAIVFLIPESTFDKFPRMLFPAINTLIMYAIFDALQREIVNQHIANKGVFFTGWRAAGIALIVSAIMFVVALMIILISQPNFDGEKYDQSVAEFTVHEQTALQVYNLLQTGTEKEILSFIKNTARPEWRKNKRLVESMNTIENLPEELMKQNRILMEYCDQRLVELDIMQVVVCDSTGNSWPRMDSIAAAIEGTLLELEEMQ